MMNNYEVLIRGENFYLKDDSGKVVKVGFYTHRYFKSSSVEEAREKAKELILSEVKKDFLNDDLNPGEIDIEEIVVLKSFDGVTLPGAGYTFYPMEPNLLHRILNMITKRKGQGWKSGDTRSDPN